MKKLVYMSDILKKLISQRWGNGYPDITTTKSLEYVHNIASSK